MAPLPISVAQMMRKVEDRIDKEIIDDMLEYIGDQDDNLSGDIKGRLFTKKMLYMTL